MAKNAQYQQALELRKKNPNLSVADAVWQVKAQQAPIANAPVAWVAPAVTPPTPVQPPATPVVNQNQQVLEQNRAKVQAEIQAGTRPEVGQKVQEKPIQPQVEIPSQLSTQDQATIDRMTAEGRFWEPPAQLLPTAKQVEPLKDTTTKEPLIQPPATISGMYNAIVAKQDIPDVQKQLPSYKIAQNRYQKASMYQSMSPSQVLQDVTEGKLVEWSSTWEDLKTINPKLVQDVSNLRKVNKSSPMIYTNNPDGTRTNNLVTSFTEDYMQNFGDFITNMYKIESPEEIRSKIYTPDVKYAEDSANRIEGEMNNVLDSMATIDEDVDKEFAWTGATGSRIALEKAYRQEKLQQKYDSLERRYTTQANIANKLITENTAIYQTTQQQKQAQNAALLPFITDQYKSEVEKRKAEELRNDPVTQVTNLVDEFKKQGIPFARSTQEMIQEAQNYIAQGWTLADYLTDLQGKIQSKPEYKRIQELQAGKLTDREKMDLWYQQDIAKIKLQDQLEKAKTIASSKLTKLDDWLYQDKNGNIITADEIKTSKLVNNSYLTKDIWQEWGECGFYASRGTWMTSTPGWNSKEARTKAFSDKTPEVWGMAFFGWPWYDETYGHIGIITWVNPDGTISIKDSNYNGDKMVWERTVPASSATGFYNNTPLANGLSSVSKPSSEYNDQNITDLAYLVELQDKNPTQAAKDMKELWYTARDIANYKAGNVPLTEKQKTVSSELMNDIADLVQNYDYTDATGWHFFDEAPRWSDWENANTKIDNIVSKLTLPSLGMLKWPMSDKDLAFIKAASNNLATTQSDASFERQLIKAYNLAARRAGKPEIEKLSDITVEKNLADSF